MAAASPSDRTTLCLACSASLPPRRTKPPLPLGDPSSASASRKPFEPADDTFYTPCCRRPICPSCLASNPRLARYNPCLHCLGGVGVVSARSTPPSTQAQAGVDASASGASPSPLYTPNIDGGVHDEDVFVVGDEDDDDETELGHGHERERERLHTPELVTEDRMFSGESLESSPEPSTPPPPYEEAKDGDIAHPVSCEDTQDEKYSAASADDKHSQPPAPLKYYIKPGDTLLGISLKYGIDGRLLCRLNNLPPSTLRTTPHLLHTRTFLTLPPTAQHAASSPAKSAVEDAEHEARRAREKAEKRFQMLTKEVDWRVAKAYVAVADTPGDEEIATPSESKVQGEEKKVLVRDPYTGVESSLNLEARAIDRYLDDDEWEERERKAGRGASIPKFPIYDAKGKKTERKSWWKLR